MHQSNIKAGTAIADITPPLEVGLLSSSIKGSYVIFESVRLPLKARVLVLESGNELVAVVALDLLALSNTSVGDWEQFKKGMSSIIPPHKIILTCTHTHNAPESAGLSSLYLTEAYRNWLNDTQTTINNAIIQAVESLQPCEVFYCVDMLKGFSLQRRISTSKGIVMSDSVQPISNELMQKQPIDHRVHTIRFKNGDKVLATVVQAACHPVHEMCIPHISAEFPGELCAVLEASGKNGLPLFLNGAAGDINPPTVSMGATDARRHGEALAKIVAQQDGLRTDEWEVKSGYKEWQLSIRPEMNMVNKGDALARFNAISLGQLAIVFLPGEVFTETALAIEKTSPFAQTIVVGFSENNIGYVPTEQAFDEGGYEIGPGKWSFLPKGADKIIMAKALELLQELHEEQYVSLAVNEKIRDEIIHAKNKNSNSEKL